MTTFAKTLFALVLTAAMGLSGAAFAGNKSDNLYQPIDFTNYGNETIWNIQVFGVDGDRAGDLLGQYTLDSDEHVVIDVPRVNGECHFDVKLTYADNSTQMLWNVNICNTSSITVDEDGETEIA